MAGDSDQEDRTEDPTAKKLQDARDKGQVPRARELTTMMVTLAGAVTLMVTGRGLAEAFMALMRHQFSPDVIAGTATEDLPLALFGALADGLLLIVPFLVVSILAVLYSSTVLGGWTFKLQFKPETLNPIAGIQKLLSMNSFVELIKSLLKVIFIGSVAWVLLNNTSDKLLMLGRISPEVAIRESAGLIVNFFLIVSLPLIAIALIDTPWQWYNHHKQLRMTKQEVMDEHKESDGRPEVKGRIRELQMAASRRRMMEQVPKADVVITNPTHFAVALRYDQARGGAPMLVAKGADEVAARIREVAGEHQIPLISSPRLARAVFASTELDQEIPPGLYLAVAQILTYLYQLRQWEALGGEYPEQPVPEVSDEYLKDLA